MEFNGIHIRKKVSDTGKAFSCHKVEGNQYHEERESLWSSAIMALGASEKSNFPKQHREAK